MFDSCPTMPPNLSHAPAASPTAIARRGAYGARAATGYCFFAPHFSRLELSASIALLTSALRGVQGSSSKSGAGFRVNWGFAADIPHFNFVQKFTASWGGARFLPIADVRWRQVFSAVRLSTVPPVSTVPTCDGVRFRRLRHPRSWLVRRNRSSDDVGTNR